MQDCYPSKRATNQTTVLFHLSAPVGTACTAKSRSEHGPCLQPFHSCPRTKPMRIFRVGSSFMSLGQEYQAARGRSANLCAATAPVCLARYMIPLKRKRCRRTCQSRRDNGLRALAFSLARPDGTVTGLSSQGTDYGGKQIELLGEIVPPYIA
jgi:hypothetical protein